MYDDFWNEARMQLLAWRASSAGGLPPTLGALRTALEGAARLIDPNRPTSNYNLPSVYQAGFDSIIAQAMYVAKIWLRDGRPVVPSV